MSFFNSNNIYPPNEYQQQQQQQQQQGNNFNSNLLSAPNLPMNNNNQPPNNFQLNSFNNNYITSNNNANSVNTSSNQQQQPRLQSPGILFNNLAANPNEFNSTSLPSSSTSSYQSLALSSPQSSNASLFSTHRAKFMCSKGFEIDDDLEFCPEIIPNANAKRFNPYTSSSFSPTSNSTTMNLSMTTAPAASTSPPSSLMSTPTAVIPNRPSSPSPRVFTPRAKKILEIVNPNTGMRIGSPNNSHATISPIT